MEVLAEEVSEVVVEVLVSGPPVSDRALDLLAEQGRAVQQRLDLVVRAEDLRPIHRIDDIDLTIVAPIITGPIIAVGIGIRRGGMDLTEEGGTIHLDTGAAELCLL